MVHKVVYTNTAYDSQAPRKLEPGPPLEEWGGYVNQVAIGRPLNLPTGAHCREPLAEDSICIEEDLDFLRGPDSAPKAYQNTEDAPHIKAIWPTMFEWAVVLRTLRYIAAWFAISGAAACLLFGFLNGMEVGIGFFKFSFLPLFGVWLFFKLLTRGEPKLKKDTRFYRRTGMVSIYQKGKPRLEIPFDEFDPHMTTRTAATGSTGFTLQLVHRYSDLVISHINDYPEEFEVYLEWENLTQFMDISQPLPDTLINEPARQFDPVTAEYDRKTERPKHLWRDMDREELRERRDAAKKAAKYFPWGKTREQALASGWKPSEQRIHSYH